MGGGRQESLSFALFLSSSNLFSQQVYPGYNPPVTHWRHGSHGAFMCLLEKPPILGWHILRRESGRGERERGEKGGRGLRPERKNEGKREGEKKRERHSPCDLFWKSFPFFFFFFFLFAIFSSHTASSSPSSSLFAALPSALLFNFLFPSFSFLT